MLETLSTTAAATLQRNLGAVLPMGKAPKVDGLAGPKTRRAVGEAIRKNRKIRRAVTKAKDKNEKQVEKAAVEAIEALAEEARTAKRQIKGNLVEGLAGAVLAGTAALAGLEQLIPELQGHLTAIDAASGWGWIGPAVAAVIVAGRIWQRLRAAGIFGG